MPPELQKYNFNCPMCEKSYYTYIDRKKTDILYASNRPHVKRIFEGYPPNYREIFINNYCDKCQELMFGKQLFKFTLPMNANNNEDERLQHTIVKIIESMNND